MDFFFKLNLLPPLLSLLAGRDSGNDFRVPKIGSDNSRFSFILFSYHHVVPLNDHCFLELTFVSGAD